MDIPTNKPIILFDGVCNLCSGFVQFMIERDPDAHFRFASLQSDAGKALLKKHGLATDTIDTVVMVENDQVYLRSEVGLRIASQMKGLWPVLSVLRILPLWFRDPIYDFIAARRYRWFGQKDQCMIPTPELKSRFLDA